MHSSGCRLVCIALASIALGAAPIEGERAKAKKQIRGPQAHSAQHNQPAPPPLPCGDYLAFQVLLDRQGFSPGQIDGKPGANFTRAIAALQAARNLPVTREADCDTWHALGGDHAPPTVTTYTIADDDLKGPFEKRIPPRIADQVSLAALNYRSPLEALAERF